MASRHDKTLYLLKQGPVTPHEIVAATGGTLRDARMIICWLRRKKGHHIVSNWAGRHVISYVLVPPGVDEEDWPAKPVNDNDTVDLDEPPTFVLGSVIDNDWDGPPSIDPREI